MQKLNTDGVLAVSGCPVKGEDFGIASPFYTMREEKARGAVHVRAIIKSDCTRWCEFDVFVVLLTRPGIHAEQSIRL